MKNAVVLFRASLAEESEMAIAKKYFPVYTNRGAIPANSYVVARYSALPFYQELEADLGDRGSSLINSYRDHAYIADLFNWYSDLKDYTFKTWTDLASVPRDAGPFVLKGATNSKKQNWKTHMYAEDWEAAGQVYSRLSQDGYIGYQDIYIRQYEPLRNLRTGIQGLPITEEYRFFYCGTTQLSGAYYWSEHFDLLDNHDLTPDHVPQEWLAEIAEKVATRSTFFVLDIGRTATGDWRLIEINDAQMSGLSLNDPDVLYKNLKEKLSR